MKIRTTGHEPKSYPADSGTPADVQIISFSSGVGFASAGWLTLLAALFSCVVSFAGEAPAPPKSAPAPATLATQASAPSPWQRIVMIGASASAGFVLSEPLGGTNTLQCRLDRYLDAALLAPHDPVRNLASSFFFLQPEMQGSKQVEQAIQAQPTLVIGADFLFWFCYGAGNTDEERLRRFETGLKSLETIPCPLLLGDIPDASAAAKGILSPGQIPSAAAMTAANRRLKEWAAIHPQVVVLPLSGFMRGAMANEALTLHGKILAAGSTRALLQNDKLHPTPAGSAAVAVAILDALQSAQPARFAGEVRWDPAVVLRLGLAQTQGAGQTSDPVPAASDGGK